MARLNKKRTETLRADPEFVKFVSNLSRLKSFQEKDRITPSRITQAIFNQYLKYPNLVSEINGSKLGRWSSK